jgi:hypothetical protein
MKNRCSASYEQPGFSSIGRAALQNLTDAQIEEMLLVLPLKAFPVLRPKKTHALFRYSANGVMEFFILMKAPVPLNMEFLRVKLPTKIFSVKTLMAPFQLISIGTMQMPVTVMFDFFVVLTGQSNRNRANW